MVLNNHQCQKKQQIKKQDLYDTVYIIDQLHRNWVTYYDNERCEKYNKINSGVQNQHKGKNILLKTILISLNAQVLSYQRRIKESGNESNNFHLHLVSILPLLSCLQRRYDSGWLWMTLYPWQHDHFLYFATHSWPSRTEKNIRNTLTLGV